MSDDWLDEISRRRIDEYAHLERERRDLARLGYGAGEIVIIRTDDDGPAGVALLMDDGVMGPNKLRGR